MTDLPEALTHPIHLRLLRLLAAHRFATTTQLARLTADAYASLRSGLRQSLRHLNKLRAHDLVTRLERRVGGWQAGSSVTVWALTTRGHRALTGSRTRRRPHELSTGFLAHRLVVTETSTIITETVRTMEGGDLQLDTEPDCWRTYLGAGGERLTLRPDLAATITSPDYYLEVDRDTENPARIIIACHRYTAYRDTGADQQRTGVFPLVVWVVPHTRRRRRLQEAIARDAALNPRLFRVITPDQLPALIHDGPDALPPPALPAT